MLVLKPVLCYLSQKARLPEPAGASPLEAALVSEQDAAQEPHTPPPDLGHESFGEIMVHQLIEVIEFVLGSVSNTASYLRLWALSLAHSQLASVAPAHQVFLQMTVTSGLKSGSALSIFIGFPVWFGSTVGVLMMMDLLECFLHTLRLHW